MAIKTESTRISFTEGLMDAIVENPDIVLVCADSLKVIKGEPFKEKYPDRVIDVGIAEQNAVACAAGLASCGLVPFVATYAGFITMRACEQVRTFVAYPGLNVKFVGANGGMGSGEREGVTHQFFEDIGILRTIPGITVVVPADASQVRKAVKEVARIDGPAYIRIGSGRDPVVFENDEPFELGKIRVLRDYGNDVAIFTNGFVINRALEAGRLLAQEGIKPIIVEVHTLKPLETDAVADILRKTGCAVTVEDHNIIGGLGSAIAETAVANFPVPVETVGLRDIYPESGESEALLDRYNIGINDVILAARKAVARKKEVSR